MKEIRLPSQLGLSRPGELSQALAPLRRLEEGEALCLDLVQAERAGAFAIAALGAQLAARVADKRLGDGSMVRTSDKNRVFEDLERMGLLRMLEENSLRVFTGQMESGRPQELWLARREEDLQPIALRMENVLGSLLPGALSDLDNLLKLLAGLAQNAFQHGRPEGAVMLCGQAYPQSGWVELGLADAGRGLAASLGERVQLPAGEAADAEALQAAVSLSVREPGGETRPGSLRRALEHVRRAGGELTLLSGGAALVYAHGELRSQAVAPYRGTALGLRVRVVKPAKPGAAAPAEAAPAAPPASAEA